MLAAYLTIMATVDPSWILRRSTFRPAQWLRRKHIGTAMAILLALGLATVGLSKFLLQTDSEQVRYYAWQGPRADAVGRETQVATTSAEWNTLWSGLRHDPPPAFNPGRQTGVAIMLGQRPTPGYQINIIGTEHRGDRLIVVIEETRPAGDLPLAQVTTSPYAILLINQSGAPVSIEQRVRD